MIIMKNITQKDDFGCGIACTASVLNLNYEQAKKLFHNPIFVGLQQSVTLSQGVDSQSATFLISIIPFYNEEERILSVLQTLSSITQLTTIIVVDD